MVAFFVELVVYVKNKGLPCMRVRALREEYLDTAARPARESKRLALPQSSITKAVYGSDDDVSFVGAVQSMTNFSSSGENLKKKGAPGKSPESNKGIESTAPYD